MTLRYRLLFQLLKLIAHCEDQISLMFHPQFTYMIFIYLYSNKETVVYARCQVRRWGSETRKSLSVFIPTEVQKNGSKADVLNARPSLERITETTDDFRQR